MRFCFTRQLSKLRRQAELALLLVVFTAPVVCADVLIGGQSLQLPADSLIIDRPNTDRLITPNFKAKEQPSFRLPDAEKALLPNKYQRAVKIKLRAIKFVGNTVISEAELQNIAHAFVGKVVSVAELETLRLQISAYYAQQGYVNSGALLPEQHFKDGVITVQIIEGKLNDIRVQGTGWLSPHYVSDRLYDTEQVLNIHQLRENFQLLLLDPLIERMNGSLIPSKQRGTSVLDVEVARARPYQLTLTTDNYNPPSIGSAVGHLTGSVHNLTGLGDVVTGSVAYSEGLLGGSGSFSVPLNADNTRFNFHFDRSDTAIVEKTLKPLAIKSRYVSYEFGLTQPLIETLNRTMNVGVLFNVKKNQTSWSGKPFPFSEGASDDGVSKESVLRFSLDMTERLEHHVFSARSITNVGINAFAPTWYANQSKPDGNFVSWLGQFQYIGQVWNSDATVVLRSDVQYSDDKLMTLERFALGGRYSVRGYRENELVRDKGYDVSAELRYPLFKEEAENSVVGQVTVFPFIDYGAAQNRGDRAPMANLYSAGVGLAWQPFEQVNTEILYAHALKSTTPKADYDLQDSGVAWRVNISAF